jgi:hypothetical protein
MNHLFKEIAYMSKRLGLFLLCSMMILLFACNGGGGGDNGESGNGGSESVDTTYSISGTITLNGAGLPGVAVAVSGDSSGTTTTDASGSYSFSGLVNGTYIITPTLSGYVFTDTSKAVTVNGTNIEGADFSATQNPSSTYIISGTVTKNPSGVLSGVTLTLRGTISGTVLSDTNGHYSFPGLVNGSYTVTPSIAGYYFVPTSLTISINETNKTSIDFVASIATSGSERWTWVSGDSTVNQAGVYGSKGITANTNKPGARDMFASWVDRNGNYWIFGGRGYDSTGSLFYGLNDLWKFDGANWSWVSGDSTATIYNDIGVYGTLGVAANTNIPGKRYGSASCTDISGNFWLFGGEGSDSESHSGYLNDLWKFDGTNWTWISGDSIASQDGVYGTKGAAASTNKPGARVGSVCWSDNNGNFWLFGGLEESGGFHNDLWKFDGTNWTWVSGDNISLQNGIYGTKGVTTSSNKPGCREGSVIWIDSNSNIWLFGGYGWGFLNDLWKFDGNNWTWISGSDSSVYQSGVYGTKGIAADTNVPGVRYIGANWIDVNGNLWIFGGYGYDKTGSQGRLNDLWKFEP